jgi:hypothetical protein
MASAGHFLAPVSPSVGTLLAYRDKTGRQRYFGDTLFLTSDPRNFALGVIPHAAKYARDIK